MKKVKTLSTVLFIMAALFVGVLGISYGGFSDTLVQTYNIYTGKMDFAFADPVNISTPEETFTISMQSGECGEAVELDADISYKDKQLFITNIDTINASEFIKGNTIFKINYAIIAADDKQGIRQVAAIEGEDDAGYNLGIIDFELQSKTPVWCVESGENHWGTDTDFPGGTPDVVYQLLPDTLARFDAFHTVQPADQNGIICGTIILKQIGNLNFPEPPEIGLSSLEFDDEINMKIANSPIYGYLEIEAVYGFIISINFDQYNVNKGDY